MKTLRGLYPMGEIQNQPFQLSFNALLKVDFQGSQVTSEPKKKSGLESLDRCIV